MSEQTGDPRALVEHMAKALVDAPAEVLVDPVDEGAETVLELTVALPDVGRVIGKAGRNARAMRIILSAASLKANKRYSLEILE